MTPPGELAPRPLVEVVAVLANMVESALAARPSEVGDERAPDPGREPDHDHLDEREEHVDERGRGVRGVDEDRPPAPGAGSGGLCPAVDAGAGARARRVDRPAVRAGRAGRGAGLGPPRRGGDRRRPGGVRAVDRGPRRVPRPGVAGVPGRGRGDFRVGDFPAGPLLGGPVAAAGAGPVDRHPAHRRRRRLRPDRLQRPAAAGVEGHDERGGAAPAGRPRNGPRPPAASCAPHCRSATSTTIRAPP